MKTIFKLLLMLGLYVGASHSPAHANQTVQGVVTKMNKAGQVLEITAWSDNFRRDKYSVTDPSNRWRYYWFADGGSANSGANNAPHSTSHDAWCRVRELYGDSVHVPECNHKFMYKSYVITGFNNKHYEIWYRPGSLSYYKFREKESGLWYAHDGSSNDGRQQTTKDQWCRIILFHGNGIIRSPRTCDEIRQKMIAAGTGKASQQVASSEITALIEMGEEVNELHDLVVGPQGYLVGKTAGALVGSIMDAHGLRGTNAAGTAAEIVGENAATAVLSTLAVGGGPASALAAFAVSASVAGTKALVNASKDTTLSMYPDFETHPRFDLDLNGISTSRAHWLRLPGSTEMINCAAENQRCDFHGTRYVRYGAKGQYIRKLATNGITCSYQTFGGDPVPGVHKNCYYENLVALKNGQNLCLDASAHTARTEGGKVQVWECLGNSVQRWERDGEQLRNGQGLCLDADGGTVYQNGGKVQLWVCSDYDNQKWIRNGDSLVNRQSGLCLDASASTATQNGGRVQLWTCNGSKYQKWSWK